jgi:hypothetical protein
MSAAALLVLALYAGAVDPTSARAIAKQNAAHLDTAAAALAGGDPGGAAAALADVDDADRRLDRERLLRLRLRARVALGLTREAVDDGLQLRARVPNDSSLNVELAELLAGLGRFDECATVVLTAHDGASLVGTLSTTAALTAARCLRATPRRAQAHDVLTGHHSGAARRLRAQMLLEDGAPVAARAEVAALLAAPPATSLLADDTAPQKLGSEPQARGVERDDLGGAGHRACVPTSGPRATAGEQQAHDAGNANDGCVESPTAGSADAVSDDDLAAFAAAFRAAHDAAFADVLDAVLAARAPERRVASSARSAGLVVDDATRLRNRIAGLAAAADVERLLALLPRARAAGFFDDDDIRYAFAWAAFAAGEFDVADTCLAGVTSESGFARAAELRAAIAAATRASCGGEPCRR